MKIIAKTESVSEFLARGGKVTKLPVKDATKKYTKKLIRAAMMEDVDMSAIPLALKISLGLK